MVNAVLLVILYAKPAQGTAPAAFGIGFILGQKLLVNGQGLVKLPRSAKIIARIIGSVIIAPQLVQVPSWFSGKGEMFPPQYLHFRIAKCAHRL